MHDLTDEERRTNPDGSKCTSWIQDSKTGKLIPRSRYQVVDQPLHTIMKPMTAFQSPIDKTMITCRSQLRAHNKKHGVTNIGDYSADHFEKKGIENANKAQGKTPEAKMARREALARTMYEHGIR